MIEFIRYIFSLCTLLFASVCLSALSYNSGEPLPECPTEIIEEQAEPEVTEQAVEDSTIIYDIPLSEEYQRFISYCCVKYGVDYKLALAVMTVENRTYDVDIVSNTADYGLFQINTICFKELRENGLLPDFCSILDPYTNIECGVYLLSKCEYDEPHLVACQYHNGESGARELWNNGIWSTGYTEKVLKEMRTLKCKL